MEGGKIIRSAPGVPPNGELGYLPYKGGIIEDTISSKGIIKIYRTHTGILEHDVKSIADRAKNGNTMAIGAFEEFGQTTGQMLKPYFEDFKVECIIIGGQIAKSFEFFAATLRNELASISSLRKVMQAESIDFSPLYGLLSRIKAVL